MGEYTRDLAVSQYGRQMRLKRSRASEWPASDAPFACDRAAHSRWETPEQPDESGEQMAALRSYLIANPHIDFVFYDFASMPQGASPALLECTLAQAHPRGRLLLCAGNRTPDELRAFNLMLVNINILYLGASVLILADNSYMSRFWTQARASATPPTAFCSLSPSR